ncbi:MAG TPA: hypothetical protein VNO52_16740 [Methylomirabilota bacterium]|nr:hypothetical protein [Methylomirabilota bacterium]
MNEADLNPLRDAVWRRKLSPAEESRLQSYLAARPEAQLEWEDELALTQALASLPQAPLSSNFTAQVMHQITREQRAADGATGRGSLWPDWLRRWAPRLGWAGLVLLAAATGFLYHQNSSQREFAQNVAAVPSLAAVPGPDILREFDAINQLRHATAASDDALIEYLR